MHEVYRCETLLNTKATQCSVRKERAAKLGRKKRKGQLIAIGVIAAVAIGVGVGIYNYVQNPPRTTEFGALGSTHEHASFKLFINGEEPVDFSLPPYQVKSRLIHFEDDDGDIIHLHATRVDLGFLFESFNMKFDSECITLANGTSYCNDGDKTVKFYVNGIRNAMYDRYVLRDGDRMLLTYGNETEEQIQEQLNELDKIMIPGVMTP